MKKSSGLLIIIICITLISCSNHPQRNEDSTNSSRAQFDSYQECLGKPLTEISNSYVISYSWFDDGTQKIKTPDGSLFYFSKPVWEDVSCSAILINGGSLSHNGTSFSVDQMSKIFGTDYIQDSATIEGRETYTYYLTDYKVIFYFNDNHEILPEEYGALIVDNDETESVNTIMCEINNSKSIKTQSDTRNTTNWDEVNESIILLGKSKDDIIDGNNELWRFHKGEDNYGGDYYQNGENGIRIRVDSETNICKGVLLPNTMLFKNYESSISMKTMIGYWNVPFSWGNYEDTMYTLKFNDITVKIPSDDGGGVSNNGYTIIERTLE